MEIVIALVIVAGVIGIVYAARNKGGGKGGANSRPNDGGPTQPK